MAKRGVAFWIGWVLTILIVALFLMSGIMKFVGGKEMEEGVAKIGIPMKVIVPLAITEITCTILYLIPWTSVLGAILLTGYMGGAICTHMRVDEPFFLHIGIGVALWLALCLRDSRLWQFIPIRR